MSKITIDDFKKIESELNNKLESWKPDDVESIDDIKDYLSQPEIVNSLAQRAYTKIEELRSTYKPKQFTKQLLDEIGLDCYLWHKVYNDWPESELRTEVKQSC